MSQPFTPHCAVHPGLPATGACTHCQRFFCSVCLAEQGEASLCVSCQYALSQAGRSKLPEQRTDFRGTGRVDLGRWIGAGWQLLSANLGAWLLASLLVQAIGAVTCMVAYPALMCGLYHMALRQIRGERIAADQVFWGFRRFWPALGFGLLFSVPVFPVYGLMAARIFPLFAIKNPPLEQAMEIWFLALAGYGFLFLYLLLAWTVSFFAHARLTATAVGPIHAITDSWQVVRRNFWMYVLTAFVFMLIQGLAGQVVCIGTLFAIPLTTLASAQAYVDHFGLDDANLLHE
jgi:hypothetical protein